MLLLLLCVRIIVEFVHIWAITLTVISFVLGLISSLLCFLNFCDESFFIFFVWLDEIIFCDSFAQKNYTIPMSITNIAILGLLPFMRSRYFKMAKDPGEYQSLTRIRFRIIVTVLFLDIFILIFIYLFLLYMSKFSLNCFL